ncbi:MAG: hypothetical protein K8R58_12310 [Bacteroidales bacterium]|nr:hypothetical protein [Bacteroidales bacterium]
MLIKSIYLDFLKKISIFSVIIAIIIYAVLFFLPDNFKTPALPYLFFFFFALTLAVHYVLLKASEKKFSKFFNYFMLSTVVKLLIYFSVILLYVYINREDTIAFIITFFILYILFTAFEVISILKYPKSENKS